MLAYSRVTPQVYVGPQYNQRGKKLLESEGVNADVNLRIEYDDAAHGLALEHYCHLPTVDDDGPSPEHFQKGVDFIDGVVRNGGKVYIHCKAGVGRAPTMAAAYFISTGMTATEALALIKETRPFITPTRPQIEALQRYETYVKGNGRTNESSGVFP
ncbi:MAG: dual specificity protein phosphatase family protein [Anaerolineales bacterium]|nr:dual specificity protein phosphatase family protein [Anaerolineales bacterium]